jgi:hypothetical protein
MKLSKTDYRGGEALVLASNSLELVVTTAVGPRIISFRSLKSEKAGNIFLQFPRDEQRANGFYFRGGHRLWHAPEDLVRTYQPDDEAVAVKPLPKGVALAQQTEEKTGLQKAMKVEIHGEKTVKITHALTNQSLWAIECAAWPVTMMRPGGYGVVPLLPKGSHEKGDLLPTWTLIPWSYTDLSAPVWDLHRDFIGINVGKAKEAHKLGLSDYPGWSAYWLDGVTFVKYAAVVPQAKYPDLGCAFETFTNGKMLEFETLSPLVNLPPKQSVTHVEYWTLLDGLPKPSSDGVFNNELLPAVKSWLRNLG